MSCCLSDGLVRVAMQSSQEHDLSGYAYCDCQLKQWLISRASNCGIQCSQRFSHKRSASMIATEYRRVHRICGGSRAQELEEWQTTRAERLARLSNEKELGGVS